MNVGVYHDLKLEFKYVSGKYPEVTRYLLRQMIRLHSAVAVVPGVELECSSNHQSLSSPGAELQGT